MIHYIYIFFQNNSLYIFSFSPFFFHFFSLFFFFIDFCFKQGSCIPVWPYQIIQDNLIFWTSSLMDQCFMVPLKLVYPVLGTVLWTSDTLEIHFTNWAKPRFSTAHVFVFRVYYKDFTILSYIFHKICETCWVWEYSPNSVQMRYKKKNRNCFVN